MCEEAIDCTSEDCSSETTVKPQIKTADEQSGTTTEQPAPEMTTIVDLIKETTASIFDAISTTISPSTTLEPETNEIEIDDVTTARAISDEEKEETTETLLDETTTPALPEFTPDVVATKRPTLRPKMDETDATTQMDELSTSSTVPTTSIEPEVNEIDATTQAPVKDKTTTISPVDAELITTALPSEDNVSGTTDQPADVTTTTTTTTIQPALNEIDIDVTTLAPAKDKTTIISTVDAEPRTTALPSDDSVTTDLPAESRTISVTDGEITTTTTTTTVQPELNEIDVTTFAFEEGQDETTQISLEETTTPAQSEVATDVAATKRPTLRPQQIDVEESSEKATTFAPEVVAETTTAETKVATDVAATKIPALRPLIVDQDEKTTALPEQVEIESDITTKSSMDDSETTEADAESIEATTKLTEQDTDITTTTEGQKLDQVTSTTASAVTESQPEEVITSTLTPDIETTTVYTKSEDASTTDYALSETTLADGEKVTELPSRTTTVESDETTRQEPRDLDIDNVIVPETTSEAVEEAEPTTTMVPESGEEQDDTTKSILDMIKGVIFGETTTPPPPTTGMVKKSKLVVNLFLWR